MNDIYDFIYLSPHLDDAVWSCGGQIAQQTQAGHRVLVLTVFAGDPPPELPQPESLRAFQLAGQPLTVAARRAEDWAALELLGAEARHLDMLDAIYRRNPRTGQSLYPHQDALFDLLAQADAALVEEVTALLREFEPLSGATVVAPLAVGHHVDHQLTRRAAEQWGAPGGRLLYYEDYPYAEYPWAIEAALFESEVELVPELVSLSEADFARKCRASAVYATQMTAFFGQEAEMVERLRAFARWHTDGASLTERVWQAVAVG